MILGITGRSGSGRHAVARILEKTYGYKKVDRYESTKLDTNAFSENFHKLLSNIRFTEEGNESRILGFYGDKMGQDINVVPPADDENYVYILEWDRYDEFKKCFPKSCIISIDTDMKTAVMRRIEESKLDVAVLHKICNDVIMEEHLYRRHKADIYMKNSPVIPPEDIAALIMEDIIKNINKNKEE